jgi:eukaryotic-like serine/threonine-protein kinase
MDIGKRYRILNEIGGGGMGKVFRALDRLTNTIVAIKQVAVSGSLLDSLNVSLDFRIALAQEFRVLSSLHHPNIISVLDYGFDQERRPYFTMEFLNNAKNIVDITANLPLKEKLHLWIQLLQALAYLHRRGVVHRDLKPENVMVVDNQVKVLDFGLATVREKEKDRKSEFLVGTLNYMAPEVLGGSPASELSDLYATGLIAYEIFARTSPYDITNFSQLLTDITNLIPDVSELDVSDEIQTIIARLLAKDPAGRFDNALDVIDALDKVTPFKIEYDNSTIRESFLQSATFVGRDTEREMLVTSLDKARHDNHGSSWLIGGVSGVGKSRLTDEFRTQALVTGTHVWRGQAIAEGGAPYFEWLPILRLLALYTDPDDLSDLEAGVLKEIIPDIETLIERAVPNAPDIDALNTQARLLNVIQGLFQRQADAIVILLEDLHWSNESLEVLRRLNEIVANLPLMIVGNYRIEERPNLPTELPGMKLIELDRLSQPEMAMLSASIAGPDGQRSDVIELLEQETEGNVFFIVEVMRVLAEEAGGLVNIGRMTLPESVFAGGIQKAMERRLQKLPDTTIPLLQFAAIAGKAVDVALLQHKFNTVDIDRWLTVCSDANVLEVQNNQWQFAHDKLRDGLLHGLSEHERANLHRQVAETIQAVYPENSIRLVNLAYHWEKASVEADTDTFTLDKAIEYLEKAADQAIENNLHNEGLVYMERLFELDKRRQQRVGDIASKEKRAHWHFLMSQALNALRRFAETRTHFEKATELYGYPLPEGRTALGAGILRHLLHQTMRRVLPTVFARRSPQEQHPQLLAAARVVRFGGAVYYVLHEPILSLYTSLSALNITEHVGESAELMEAYGLMCVLAGSFQAQGMAQGYYERALAMADVVHNPVAYASVLFLTGVYHTSAGMHEIAERDLMKSADLSTEIGNTIQWGYAMITLCSTYFNHTRYDRAAGVLKMLVGGKQTRLPEHRAMALSLQARYDMLRGNTADAVSKSSDALMALQEIENEPQISFTPWSYNALVYLRHGAYTAALEAADTTMKLATEARVNANLGYAALGNIAEVYLSLSELEPAIRPDTRENLLQKAQQVVNILRTAPPPIGKPIALRAQAWLLKLQGNNSKAEKLWEKSVQAGEAVNMNYEVARTHYEWGQHLPEGSSERKQHLETALALFKQIGATNDEKMTQSALEGKREAAIAK